MRIRFYLDEDVPYSLSQALLNRGVDVLTTQEANNCGNTDREQLKFAAKDQIACERMNVKTCKRKNGPMFTC
jgi:hypothetical protein